MVLRYKNEFENEVAMSNSFAIKGNICQSKNPMELDEKNITAKFVAGRKII